MTPEEKSMLELDFIDRIKQIVVYLDLLEIKIRRGFKRLEAMFALLGIVLLIMIVSYSLGNYFIGSVTANIFWLGFACTQFYINNPLQKDMGKFSGCLKTLEILGIAGIDETHGGGKRVKSKVSWYQKAWEALKSKKQKEAYA